MKRVQTNTLHFCTASKIVLVDSKEYHPAWYVYEKTQLRYLCSFNGRLRLNRSMGYVSGSIFASAGWCSTRAEARRRIQRAKLQKTIVIMEG